MGKRYQTGTESKWRKISQSKTPGREELLTGGSSLIPVNRLQLQKSTSEKLLAGHWAFQTDGFSTYK